MKKFLPIAFLSCFLLLALSACMQTETPQDTTEQVIPESTEIVTDEVNSKSEDISSSKDNSVSDSISGSISGSMSSSNSEIMTEDMYEVEIDNQTGSDIYGLQYSITGSEEWGEEYLGDTINDGDTTNINVPKGEEGEMFDLRVYDNQEMTGDGWIFPEIDFTNDGRIILRYKDNAPDYEYG